MVKITNCPQCGYCLTPHTQGDFCANCHWPASTWATDKIAALAAENAELKRQNEEMAARLRAARNAWGYGNDYLGDGDIKLEWPRSDELTDALNGPVPECPGCNEKDDLISHAIAITSCYLDGGLAVPDVDEAAREWLARCAADKAGQT